MDDFEEANFHAMHCIAMGLLPANNDNVTKFILLRNFTTRKELHNRYITDCEKKDQDTDWGKEASPGHEVMKCNMNVVLCEIGARIPAVDNPSGPETNADKIRYFPKEK